MIYNPETNIVKWSELLDYSEFKLLQDLPQNQLWHKEGDAFTHTCLVTQCMLDYINKQNTPKYLDPEYRQILVYSALFHDLGKAGTTELGEDGLYHCKGHAIESSKIAQNFMMQYLCLNEYVMGAIISLVRYHMQPLYIMTSKDPKKALLKLLNNLYGISIYELLLLKFCDSEGSWQENPDNYVQTLTDVLNLYHIELGFASGTLVKLTKLQNISENSNHVSVGDTYTGTLQNPVTVGWRTSLGFKFSTSPVVKIIDKNHFETKNSLYEINSI